MTRRAKQHVRELDEELAQEPSTQIYLLITEDDARALRDGRVSEDVQAQARAAMDWEWDLARAQARRSGRVP